MTGFVWHVLSECPDEETCLIHGRWEGAEPRCRHCRDGGSVCESHPEFPWEGEYGSAEGHAEHGGAGMPCPHCCSPIPQDGTHSIAEAFVPDWRR